MYIYSHKIIVIDLWLLEPSFQWIVFLMNCIFLSTINTQDTFLMYKKGSTAKERIIVIEKV